MQTLYLGKILAHSPGTMLLAILIIATVAVGITGYINFGLIKKNNNLPRSQMLVKTFVITIIEWALLILCLGVWVLTPIQLFGLNTFSLFIGACLSFLVINPTVTLFLFASSKRDFGKGIAGKKNIKTGLALTMMSTAFVIGIFLLSAIFGLSGVYILLGG